MRRLALAVGLGWLTACVPLPESYRVPEQRFLKDGPEPEPLGASISFNDPRSPDYLVQGFLGAPLEQTWRWAGESPAVRLRVSETKNLRLRMEFAFPENSHTPLLPITVRYFVNDHPLDTVVYKKAGQLSYSKPVPEEMLKKDADNIVRWEVSPVYVAEADKVKLSMILSAIGLEPVE